MRVCLRDCCLLCLVPSHHLSVVSSLPLPQLPRCHRLRLGDCQPKRPHEERGKELRVLSPGSSQRFVQVTPPAFLPELLVAFFPVELVEPLHHLASVECQGNIFVKQVVNRPQLGRHSRFGVTIRQQREASFIGRSFTNEERSSLQRLGFSSTVYCRPWSNNTSRAWADSSDPNRSATIDSWRCAHSTLLSTSCIHARLNPMMKTTKERAYWTAWLSIDGDHGTFPEGHCGSIGIIASSPVSRVHGTFRPSLRCVHMLKNDKENRKRHSTGVPVVHRRIRAYDRRRRRDSILPQSRANGQVRRRSVPRTVPVRAVGPYSGGLGHTSQQGSRSAKLPCCH